MKKAFFTLNGIVSVVLSIICFIMGSGSYEIDITYGGDAYTGIQNAAAQTARNVQSLANIVKFGFGSILLIFGITLILYAVFTGSKFAPVQPSFVPFTGGSFTNSDYQVAKSAPASVPVSEHTSEHISTSDMTSNDNTSASTQQNIQQ